jgi:hypothetical protein
MTLSIPLSLIRKQNPKATTFACNTIASPPPLPPHNALLLSRLSPLLASSLSHCHVSFALRNVVPAFTRAPSVKPSRPRRRSSPRPAPLVEDLGLQRHSNPQGSTGGSPWTSAKLSTQPVPSSGDALPSACSPRHAGKGMYVPLTLPVSHFPSGGHTDEDVSDAVADAGAYNSTLSSLSSVLPPSS